MLAGLLVGRHARVDRHKYVSHHRPPSELTASSGISRPPVDARVGAAPPGTGESTLMNGHELRVGSRETRCAQSTWFKRGHTSNTIAADALPRAFASFSPATASAATTASCKRRSARPTNDGEKQG